MKINPKSWFSLKSWIYHMSIFYTNPLPEWYDRRDRDFCSMFWRAVRRFIGWYILLAGFIGGALGAYGGLMAFDPIATILFTLVIAGIFGIFYGAIWAFDKDINGAYYRTRFAKESKEIYRSIKEKYCPIIEWIDNDVEDDYDTGADIAKEE